VFLAAAVLSGVGFFGGAESNQGEYGERIGTVRPRHARTIVSSPWGIQTGSLQERHVELAASIGVKWTRLSASWKEIESARGVYDWEQTDDAFATAIQNGITPFICLHVANPLYCAERRTRDQREIEVYGSNPLPPTKDPAALRAWLAFVQATVTRYKNTIRYWEVWNEPNHWAYWGAEPDGDEYGLLLRETAKMIKSVDPSAKVIGGALAGLDPEFTDDFLSEGAAAVIDIITFHNYASLPEERIYKAVETWKVIEKHNPTLELWQGECGFPSHSSTRDYRGTSPWGPRIQAKWLLRQSFTDVYFCRATLSNYFKLVHLGGRGEMPKRSFMTALDSILGYPERNGSRVKSVGVNEKCILENPTLNPKPAFHAYRNLCAVFDGRYKAKPTRTTVEIIDAGSFYGIGKEDDAFPSIPLVSTFQATTGSWMAAYWLPWHPQELIEKATVDLRVMGVAYADPVLVDLLDGNAYTIQMSAGADGTIVFHDIPLVDYPLLIIERSEVELE